MLEQKKVLIVDDNASIADSFKEILELYGFEAQCIYDWREVITTVSSQQFSVIFMDLNLQDMSGITLLKNIKPTVLNGNIEAKFVVVSGFSEKDSIGIEASKEFDFYLQKPVNLEKLDLILKAVA